MISQQPMFEAIVVGQGPVGQLVASLLATRGHSVAIIERHERPYRLPRAVHLTGESLRAVDAIGVAEDYDRFAVEGMGVGEFLDANHNALLRFTASGRCPQGWPLDLSLSQPDFEDILREKSSNLSGLTTITGAEVVGLKVGADHVCAEYQDRLGNKLSVRGRYLIGCDGARSFVREAGGFTVTDTGFSADWLVVDIRSDLQREWTAAVTQVCDPRRPTTCVESGPGRRRFEFMRVGDEDTTNLASLENVWSLIEPWGYTPENSILEKKEVYTFRARWADSWVDGRVLLAGDAAHQMPPMAGVGLVSGIRDAANLAWKLDLVLTGAADSSLLETYGSERIAHVQHAIWTSIGYGKLVCETDLLAAEERNRQLLALGPAALPVIPPERLGDGAFPVDALVRSKWTGTLGPQGRLQLSDGSQDLADRLNPGGFTLLLDGTRIDFETANELAGALSPAIQARILLIVAPQGKLELPGDQNISTAVDVEGIYRRRFDETEALMEIQRPDFYVYGLAYDIEEAQQLIASLPEALRLVPGGRTGRQVGAIEPVKGVL